MNTYCNLCGGKLAPGEDGAKKCDSCGALHFENPTPTADLILFNSDRKLLIAERGREPYKGQYDFPGGFVEVGESLNEAAIREAKEELQLEESEYTTPKFVASHVAVYTWGGVTKNLVPAIFTSKLLADRELIAQDDVASFRFVSMDEVDNIDFSRPDYPEIARKAYKILFN